MGSFVDLTHNAAFLHHSTGKRVWVGESKFNLEVQTHLIVVKVHFYVPCIYCVLLGNQGRKHIVKGGCQWACKTRGTGGN